MSSETITRNDLTNILNEVLPSTSVDYIVEQGTSGVWTYRKWNSGIAECWCQHIYKPTGATAWGSVYYTTPNTTVTYPSGLFVAEPITNIYHVGNAIQGWACTSIASASSITFYLVRPNSLYGNDLKFNIHTIGTWK